MGLCHLFQGHLARGVDEFGRRIYFEDFTVNDAVPVTHGLGAEFELVPDGGVDVIFHKPLCEEFWISEGTPDLLWRFVEGVVDDDGFRIFHRFFPLDGGSSRAVRRDSRSGQKVR